MIERSQIWRTWVCSPPYDSFFSELEHPGNPSDPTRMWSFCATQRRRTRRSKWAGRKWRRVGNFLPSLDLMLLEVLKANRIWSELGDHVAVPPVIEAINIMNAKHRDRDGDGDREICKAVAWLEQNRFVVLCSTGK